MKGKEEHSRGTDHEEHNSNPESCKGEMIGNSSNDNNISSSSSVPYKVEAKIEIPMFNEKNNVESLDSSLKQL